MKFKHLTLAVALLLACAASSMAQQAADITTKYDRFENTTLIQLKPMKITGGLYDGVQLGVAFKCLGDAKSCLPDKVGLGLIVVMKGAKYDLPGRLTVLADDERFQLGEMTNLGSTEVPPLGWNIIATSLVTTISPTDFAKVAKAKKIEMKLDQFEFELNADQKTALYSISTLARP